MNESAFDAGMWIEQLERGGAWIRSLLESTDDRHWRAHPAAGKWSLLEILAHLVDEEREDFRSRLLSTLHDPSLEWGRIDPEGWVVARDYAGREPQPLLEEFTAERARSLRRLQDLQDPNWEKSYRHPALGPLRAGDLLCAWVAHDHLHGQQIMRTRWQLLESSTASFSARYAMP